MLPDFSLTEILLIGLIFIWTGFVRSGLGFGGAALGLPFMLFIHNQPVYWLPIIGAHLLFFSSLTIGTQLHKVAWRYLARTAGWIIPSALVGVFGLLNLPNQWLLTFIYTITCLYGAIWMFNLAIQSQNRWLDRLYLVLGGYIAGTSLSGAPLMVAVFMRNVQKEQLRNTLFVLWFILVAIKMSTFALLGVNLHFATALMLLPIAAIGHFIGLAFHQRILSNDILFKRVLGTVLLVVSGLGLWTLY